MSQTRSCFIEMVVDGDLSIVELTRDGLGLDFGLGSCLDMRLGS